MTRLLAALLLLIAPAMLMAQSNMPPAPLANTQLPDPEQEAKARALMFQIRCLVCQGQSVGDSDAEMAQDMRALIRQRIQAGESPDQVRDWLVERYGSWVTYEPPLDPLTAPLWALPVVLIAIGLYLARGRFRRRRR